MLRVADPDGPLPDPGQFAMLATAEGWGGEEERTGVPIWRGRSRWRACGTERRTTCSRMSDPGRDGCVRWRRAMACLRWDRWDVGSPRREQERRALLVGGGVGIAPLAILQDTLTQTGSASTVLLGFRDAEHAAGARLLSDAILATDDGSVGHAGLVTDLLAAELADDAHAVVYACGSAPMLEAVRASVRVAADARRARAGGRYGVWVRRLLRVCRARARWSLSAGVHRWPCDRRL